MARSPEEQAQTERFEQAYARAQLPIMLAIERSVCGCDYGGTSWTTRDEAARLSDVLGLRPGLRLLDLGAGSGWPGLYLCALSGCDVTLVDIPSAGIRIAADRAARDRLSGACRAVVADGARLPFGDGSFDAIHHSDVLCCLKPKRAVLDACRRVIRAGATMVFTAITVAPDLQSSDHRRAVEVGPEFVESDSDYPTMLAQTGWSLADHDDLSREFAASLRRIIDADAERRDELRELLGATAVTDRQTEWRTKLAGVGDGLLRRELFVATPCTDHTTASASISTS